MRTAVRFYQYLTRKSCGSPENHTAVRPKTYFMEHHSVISNGYGHCISVSFHTCWESRYVPAKMSATLASGSSPRWRWEQRFPRSPARRSCSASWSTWGSRRRGPRHRFLTGGARQRLKLGFLNEVRYILTSRLRGKYPSYLAVWVSVLRYISHY